MEYILAPDKHTCKVAENRTDMRVYVSNRNRIYWSDNTLENWRTFAAQVENAVAIAWDSVTDRIYWSDIRDKRIYSATRNGTGVEVFIGQGLDITEGIAVDWVGRNLYWVDSSLNTIEVAALEKKGKKIPNMQVFFVEGVRAVLLHENIDQPRGLALDPRESLMFWTGLLVLSRRNNRTTLDWGQNPRIERANMDGSNRKTLVTTKIYWPNTIALDYTTNRVYFADSKLDYIDFVHYDGTGIRTTYTFRIPLIFRTNPGSCFLQIGSTSARHGHFRRFYLLQRSSSSKASGVSKISKRHVSRLSLTYFLEGPWSSRCSSSSSTVRR